MSVNILKSGPMPFQGLFTKVADMFRLIGAAASAANAVENHRTPAAADLRELGIDPKAFNIRV